MNILADFRTQRPATLADAVSALAAEGAVPLAAGTDLRCHVADTEEEHVALAQGHKLCDINQQLRRIAHQIGQRALFDDLAVDLGGNDQI